MIKRALRAGITLLVVLAAGIANGAQDMGAPRSPAEEHASFQLADPSLVIELVASEPDVVSPVALAWDADGRMFVAEMTDYPMGPTSGRIRLLEDREGKGRYQAVSVFANQLAFPTGVLPWNRGLLVTAAPDIWYLEDSNGDGVADVRQKLLTGFAEGNQQLRVNGLYWGIDNWIYGANGRSDGDVTWVEKKGTPSTNLFSIRRRDFRFRPEARQFEAIAGHSQFGTAHDDWGNRFPVFNNIPMRHVVMEERYLNRQPILASTENVVPIAEPGDLGRVFGLSPPLLLIPQPIGFFTSACGPGIYRGDQLPAEYRGNGFICEPVANVVTRRKLVSHGATFIAERTEKDLEFLAARDPWFHGVFTATGPDGALYVVDFYRKYVEHPHWVAENLKNTVAWRTGENHGRIWRIRPKGSSWKPVQAHLSTASTRQLVTHLGHPNGWWRDTAQRLIVTRRDAGAVADLVQMARGHESPVARLHALQTLSGLNSLTPEIVMERCQDADPHLRVQAVRFAESLLLLRSISGAASRNRLEEAVLALVEDPDDRVRFQVALSLGDMPNQAEALARLAQRGVTNAWQALAILTSAGPRPWLLLKQLTHHDDRWLPSIVTEQLPFLDKLGALIGAGPAEDFEDFLAWLGLVKQDAAGLVLFAGLGDGLASRDKSFRDIQKMALPSTTETKINEGVEIWFRRARTIASSSTATPELCVTAIRILGRGEPGMGGDVLLPLMLPNQHETVQVAAAKALTDLADSNLARRAFINWSSYSRAVHRQLLAAASRSARPAEAMFAAIDQGNLALVEVDPATRQALLRSKDEKLKQRAQAAFTTAAGDRGAVVRKFEPALKLAGDIERGGDLFLKTCSACHIIQGVGGKVGPDLSGISTHSKETLLVDIFDPSRQILPDYVNYSVLKQSGEVFNGFIAAESATTLTLRRPNEPDALVTRSQIQELKAEGKSIMPDGLEQGLSLQDVADLLVFLQNPTKPVLSPDP